MPLLALVNLFFQVYFAVHAIRNGKDRYWLFILIFFPGIGCIIYFFAECLPEIQRNARIRKSCAPQNPAKQLRYWQDQVEMTSSVKNRKHLAEAYVHSGRFDEAIDIYYSCLEGLNERDTGLMEGLALAYFFKSDYSNARKMIEQIRAERGGRKNGEFDLLYARCLEAQRDIDGALDEYALLVRGYSGEEARCRYALLLKKIGKVEKADEQFSQILKNARLSQKFYQKAQKQWIQVARKEGATG